MHRFERRFKCSGRYSGRYGSTKVNHVSLIFLYLNCLPDLESDPAMQTARYESEKCVGKYMRLLS